MRASRILTAVALTPAALAAALVGSTYLRGRRAIANVDPQGDTIAVFGCTATERGPSGVLRARLDHALDLYRRGRGHRLAMAGGIPPFDESHPNGGRDEVTAMVAYAVSQGVPPDRIVEVRPGQNTRQQLSSLRREVVDRGLGPVVAVSSAYHMARIADEARRQGFTVMCSAPADDPDLASARSYAAQLLADAAGSIWYALPDWVVSRLDTTAGSMRHLLLVLGTGEHTLSEVVQARRQRPR